MRMGSLFKFSDADDVEGTRIVSADAREQERREQRLRLAMRSGWPEIPRACLKFDRYGRVEDEATGNFYGVLRGEADAQYSPIVAFFIDEGGSVVFLEPPTGARTRDEFETQHAARDQAAAARRQPRVRR